MNNVLSPIIEELIPHAWKARENAFVLGKTRVGCALYSMKGNIFTGCNVEQRYRNHDVHAEVNAITNMISQGEHRFSAIVIVAERDNFTPCGSCLDWIFQFGGEDTLVAFQKEKDTTPVVYKASDLMPFYPF